MNGLSTPVSMKTDRYFKTKRLYLAVLSLQWLASIHAAPQLASDQNTNKFTMRFVPRDNTYGPCKEEFYYMNRFLLGEQLPECLSADLDTNGNWGVPTDGMQLSVRLRRSQYLQGEPVVAIVILRNLSHQSRASGQKRDVREDFEYTLSCGTNIWTWSASNSVVEPRVPPILMQTEGRMGFRYVFAPRSQRASQVVLSELFDLNQLGHYALHVTRQEPLISKSGFTNIVSGEATFSVVERLSADEIARTNALHKHQLETASKAESVRRPMKPTGFQDNY